MTVYERIKQRRKALGLTAEDVASALNVSRATIYRYESAEIEKVPITALVPLSKVLQTTPMALMGWDEEAPQPEISLEAQKIAKAFDRAKPREQEMVRLTLSEYLDETAAAAPSQTPLPPEAEAELANYRRELEAEQKGKTSYPTAEENGA